jgi:hypothetical protein
LLIHETPNRSLAEKLLARMTLLRLYSLAIDSRVLLFQRMDPESELLSRKTGRGWVRVRQKIGVGWIR